MSHRLLPRALALVAVLLLTTATAALHLSMRLCDVRPGDEVWTASATFMGGAGPITYEGGTPVFFDSEKRSWTLDPWLMVEAMEAAGVVGELQSNGSREVLAPPPPKD